VTRLGITEAIRTLLRPESQNMLAENARLPRGDDDRPFAKQCGIAPINPGAMWHCPHEPRGNVALPP
jgi:hypothetical protein